MSDLLESYADGVLTLTFNRPDSLNAVTGEMMSSLAAALEGVAARGDVRVVVVTGAGPASAPAPTWTRCASHPLIRSRRWTAPTG